MYFADFRANFLRCWTAVLFYWLKWVLKRLFYLSKFLDTNWVQFCGYESFCEI